ncbi:hypothetical protein V2J09_012610 [Rumex salicifolius]
MRMSCNGCRVLRKGCSQNCSIRPCLQWIKSSESQGNATVFLAKFYGRAGLLNLLNSGPDHLRPAVFRSLLYEACGRIVNPIYGSVGLLWSNNWSLCQAAVEAVLKGEPITPVAADSAAAAAPIKGYDIRHVVKDDSDQVLSSGSGASSGIHRVVKPRAGFKRAGLGKPKGGGGGKMAALAEAVAEMSADAPAAVEAESSSSLSHGEMTTESMVSVETDEDAAVVREATPELRNTTSEAELDLRLCL